MSQQVDEGAGEMSKRAVGILVAAIALVLTAAVSPPAAAQTFDEAVVAYNRGDYAAAYRGFRRLAEQGDAKAQYHLGTLYEHGTGVPQDYAGAVRWYRRAAERGNDMAECNLGHMFEHGQGIRQNYAEAMRWYRRAAGRGHAKAQYQLGLLLAFGRGVARDHAQAARWYRRAAEQGLVEAQINLGNLYVLGQGVSQDYAQAARWYRRAAAKGSAIAQNNIGLLYEGGNGVPKSYEQAAHWYRRAAAQGYDIAQNNLGLLYESGKGVRQSYGQAARWYRRAAAQGYAGAHYSLGRLYETGRGVRRDFIRAHMSYNLAASRSSESEEGIRAAAVRGRERVGAKLSPAGIARAQRMAREWRPGTNAAPAPPAADTEQSRKIVAAVQRSLAGLGYDPGPADGILGARTRAAIRAFQKSVGLPVDGRLSARLMDSLVAAAVAAGRVATRSGAKRRALKKVAAGSGFRVSAAGHILTNAHVVEGCTEVRVPPAPHARSRRVAVTARNDSADLALLEGPPDGRAAAFRRGRGIRPGAGIVVAGFPLNGLLAKGVIVSVGSVSALAGPGDDNRLIQISAPVQPGNSGGPVLDYSGHIVGVVVARLDAVKTARATGSIPQNVNFAVSAGTARAFLDAEGVAYATAPSVEKRAPEDVAAAARKFTVLVECWK
ncbi:MAG: hypothetical protein F4Y62_02725 [Rhodospirillaceae bacterium]|nr:hypothetical protein [Rhodospirillaceae bacterium]